jgi:hypothetical protein
MFAQPTDPFTKYMVLGRNRNADRVNGRNHALAKIMAMSQNNPKYFKTMYRLHVNDFWDLYQKIKADIAKKNTTNQPISGILKLCAFLRWLAGGIHHDIAFGYDLPHGSMHAICKEVAIAIDKNVDNIKFDLNDAEVLKELEEGISSG